MIACLIVKHNLLSPIAGSHPYLNWIERALIVGTSFLIALGVSSAIHDIDSFQYLLSD